MGKEDATVSLFMGMLVKLPLKSGNAILACFIQNLTSVLPHS